METSTDKNSEHETMEDLSDEPLQLEQTLASELDENEKSVLVDDEEEEESFRSLKRARKLIPQKKKDEAYGPQAIAKLSAGVKTNSQDADDSIGESQENKVFFTEMDEFVRSLEFRKGMTFPPITYNVERRDEVGGWTQVMDSFNDGNLANETKENIVPDAIIREVPVGKGLSATLQRLKEQGALKESVELDEFTDIRIERTDEIGCMMTPKESFRKFCHAFHGKGSVKSKQEKRIKQRSRRNRS